MARKKHVSGRARISTKEAQFLLTLDKVNKKLRRLDVNQVYGMYSAKKLLRAIQSENKIQYKRNRQEKIKINVNQLTTSQIRYYKKIFDSFLNSRTSSPLGIKEVRNKTRQALQQSLGQLVDKEITTQDIDDFYTLVADEDFRYLADKIGDSDVYILLNAAKEQKWSEPKFIEIISQYITVNNEDVRKVAENLYDKFIIGM